MTGMAEKMKCPKCGDRFSYVCGDGVGTKRAWIDYTSNQFIRTRRCRYCGFIYTTAERVYPDEQELEHDKVVDL